MFSVLVAVFVLHVLAWAVVGAGFRRALDAQPALPGEDEGLDAAEPVRDERSEPPEPISVVVAARDEERSLPPLLARLRRQTLAPSAFEVVVVDDRSTDGTAALVRQTARAWAATGGPDLRLVSVPEDAPDVPGPKKRALAAGIAEARYARLAFTDADGRPPETWLETLARHADHTPGAVLVGVGPLEPAPGALNAFVRFETVQTALLSAAGVGWGRPWHAVGRNLSVPRALFEAVGGYAHSEASLSGDDDLLVQHVARTGAAPVEVVLDPAGFVPSAAPDGWRAFWRQKRRHASAGAHYAPGALAGLAVLHGSGLALWVLAPLLHLAGSPAGWGLLAGGILVQRMALGKAFETFRVEPDLHLWQPVLSGVSAVYHAAAAVLGALPAPRRWK